MKSARLIHTGYGVWVARRRRKREAVRAAAHSSWAHLRVDPEEEAKLRKLIEDRWAEDERRRSAVATKLDMRVLDQLARNAAAIDGIPPFLGRALIYVLLAAFVVGYMLLG